MFNSYSTGDVNSTIKINACSGGIYKTYKESWFKRFHLKSNLAEILFNKEKAFYCVEQDKYEDYGRRDYKPVVVLQMIICGDMEVIAEIILKEDFDKYFENDNKEQTCKD